MSRKIFEEGYVGPVFNYEQDLIGSQECALPREVWKVEDAAVIPEGYVLVPISGTIVDRGFRFDREGQQHFPSVTIEFTPVKVGSKDETGWEERDKFTSMLQAAREKQ